MSEITIPLNKLVPFSGNVRKTGAADGIGELAASIAAHGLLQSLVVRKTSRGRFAVVAGQRRLAALSRLAGEGSIASDLAVPCRVLAADADAAEISLAENVVRAPMHPADQFEAFSALIARGGSAADVAARFGVSEAIVLKRMKLGRVSPVLLDAYRRGEMSLEQVQAFTVSDDHGAQENVWEARMRHPQAIREALTEGEIPATDRRVRLVTLDAYEAAGGAVRRDLFDEGGGYAQDVVLLDRLALAALEAAAEALRAEGWKWVETRAEFDWQAREAFRQVYPQAAAWSESEEAEVEHLEEERAALLDRAAEEDDADSVDPAIDTRLLEINARLSEFASRPQTFAAEAYAHAGAVVTIGYDGDVALHRGLIRKGDAADEAGGTASPRARASDTLPASVIETLTQHRTAALQAELIARPDVALATVVHALVLRTFYRYGGESTLGLSLRTPNLPAAGDSRAEAVLSAGRDRWGSHLPAEAGALWDWCLQQTPERLLELLAFVTALGVDAVQRKGDQPGLSRLRHADALARALALDMTAWFAPTAEIYFSRIGKPAIAAAIAEANPAYSATTFLREKKAALAAIAERTVAGTGWLPVPLRAGRTDPAEEAGAAMLDQAA